MKKVIQLFLFFLILLAIFFFNNLYFSNNKKNVIKTNNTDQEVTQESNKNIIKNLKYEITLDDKSKYIISSDYSELSNVNGVEIVQMQKVIAIFFDQKTLPYIINADSAEYNSNLKSTKFMNNVSIEYLDNKIFSERLDLNFFDYTAKIFQNVRFVRPDSVISTDNIDINLLTKRIDIYMDNQKDKVEFNKN